jgi:uncharacterized protein YkwD
LGTTGGFIRVQTCCSIATTPRLILAVVIAILTASIPPILFTTEVLASHDDGAFERVWERTDRPVKDQIADRTWMWGPEPFSGVLHEEYADSPDGERTVAYFDKSRMEINDPTGNADDPWYVTNGLLARDLILGKIQIGDNQFRDLAPPEINVAGDSDDPHGPTYQTFHGVMGVPPLPVGEAVIQTIDRTGKVESHPALADYGVTVDRVVPATNHSIASVFWDFMNSRGPIHLDDRTTEGRLFFNPFYATGYPLTEPYWTHVSVDGQRQHVLIQVFERRVLTYTPGNPDGWAVESGNAGLHYYHWKYAVLDDEPDPHDTAPVGDNDVDVCLDSFEQEFLGLINDYRHEHGVPTLENSAALNIASYWHSVDMGQHSFFSHTSSDGRSPFDRMDYAGYAYNTIRAENIAAGQTTAEHVFEAWRTSPGHNANMLNPHLQVIGIGRAEVPGSRHGVYWTTKFGGVVDAAPGCPVAGDPSS